MVMTTGKLLVLPVTERQVYRKRSWKKVLSYIMKSFCCKSLNYKKVCPSVPVRAKQLSVSRVCASCPSNPTVALHWGCLCWKENFFFFLLKLMASYSTKRPLQHKDVKKNSGIAMVLTTRPGWDNVKICKTSEMWWNNSGNCWQKSVFAERICLLKQWVTRLPRRVR